jgi:ABC-2 type transport system ATP-binding protein
MMVSEAPITVRGLRKAYSEREVLRGVDLSVGHGEVVALLGPNGAGKTTTIEILEGYREPSGGSVRVLGFDPWSHPRELRQRTGVVLQECGFPDHARVHELVDAWRSYYPSPRSRADLLALVELESETRTLVRRLSGGQRRRLDFALALAGDPEVIFLDEPTTGFDPEARRRCWSVIENLAALGKTILLTTHYLDEAERLADRVAVLADGVIRAVGNVNELAALADTPTSISFRANGWSYDAFAGLDAVVDGGRVCIQSREPSKDLQQLIRSFGDLADLVVAPPTLEDSYLRLVTTGQESRS